MNNINTMNNKTVRVTGVISGFLNQKNQRVETPEILISNKRFCTKIIMIDNSRKLKVWSLYGSRSYLQRLICGQNITVKRIKVKRNNINSKELIIDSKIKYSFLDSSFQLGYYIPSRFTDSDGFSNNLLCFKDAEEEVVSQMIDLSVNKLPQHISKVDIIIRSLSSSETESYNNSPLDRLGEALVKKYPGSEYNPCLLKKYQETDELKYLGGRDFRDQELEGVYYFDDYEMSIEKRNKHLDILLIDDVITTGATTSAIKEAISEEITSFNLHFFSLARTYSERYDNLNTVTNHNSRILNELKSRY